MDMQKCKKALSQTTWAGGGEGIWTAIVSLWREQTSLPLSGTRQETPPDPKAYGHWTNSGQCFWSMSDSLTTRGGIKRGTAQERCGEERIYGTITKRKRML